MAVSNYFKDLELEITATGNDVRTAYKRLAKQWHPDKNKESGAEEKFKQILAAYNHLQSDDRRETLARELKRQNESKAAPTPKPPPQPPPSAQPPTRPSSTHSFQQAKHSEDARPKSSKSKTKQSNASTTKTSNGSWWDNYKSNNSNNSENKKESNQKTKFKRTKFSRNSPERFMHSFMNFDDPFDDILFSIFMIPPSKSPPKSKPRTDPFGNKLPNNLMSENIYDWKSATKGRGQQPDYQEYLDDETEFACHYCGLLMEIDMLRKHEPRCQRLGGKTVKPDYQFDDEEVNEAYATNFNTKPSQGSKPKSFARKIVCRWCGQSFRAGVAAAHIAQCQLDRTTPRNTQGRPEWNNNFTETEYNEPPESIFEERPRSSRINIDDFNPFANSPRKACLSCKVKYGLTAPNYCMHC